jgi:hypothetical protein
MGRGRKERARGVQGKNGLFLYVLSLGMPSLSISPLAIQHTFVFVTVNEGWMYCAASASRSVFC